MFPQLWQALQGVCSCHAVEGETTRSALLALKAAGHSIVGLTARGPEVADETFEQLRQCGLDGIFDTASLGVLPSVSEESSALLKPSVPLAVPVKKAVPLKHMHGIVFCSDSRKPEGLLAFEEACGKAVAPRVVLIDDRRSHCDAVGVALASRGRQFLGLHYTHPSPRDPSHPARVEVPQESPELARGWTILAHALATRRAARERVCTNNKYCHFPPIKSAFQHAIPLPSS